MNGTKLLFFICMSWATCSCSNGPKTSATGLNSPPPSLPERVFEPLSPKQPRAFISEEVHHNIGENTSIWGARKDFSNVRRLSPQYPTELLGRGIAGEVEIDFVIDSRGTVTDPHVVKSADPLFTASVLSAMKSWQYSPAKIGRYVLNIRTRVTVTFSLFESTIQESKLGTRN